MIKIHLKDGKTLSFISSDPAQISKCMDLLSTAHFQENISGFTITNQGVSYSIPKPRDFGSSFMTIEAVQTEKEKLIKGYERVICHTGDIGISVTTYNSQKAARVDVTRPGRQTYNPYRLGG